jgi:selenocysteine lyase/cysteine desulfurase
MTGRAKTVGPMTIPASSDAHCFTGMDLSSQMRQLFVRQDDTLQMDAGAVGAQLCGPFDHDEPVCSTFLEARRAIAPGFGCDASELVITQSTTDSLCRILAGLDLHHGDEVLTTNHEHYGGLAPLAIARDRLGIVIKTITLPLGAHQSVEDYIARFASAFTAKTRILLFSAPTSTTGALLPIASLARLAQEHGCISIVDGAHIPGMLNCKFEELGVDFLAGSGTKWQCGPPGTGLLYVRNRVLPQFNAEPLPAFWPVISIWYPLEGGLPPRSVTGTPSYDIAEYLQTSGSSSLARVRAFQAACETWDRIGRDRIEQHVLNLSQYLKNLVAEVWGEASLYSPRDDLRLHSAICAFSPFHDASDACDESRFRKFVTSLEAEHRIVVRCTALQVTGIAQPRFAVRIATRAFHDRHDVEHLVICMEKLLRDADW